ncbi:MAG: CBS domain-containing protein [Candidatus Altiarchaeota archaeon]|nr:CBS domain-containing protein [Candidatus Altiarchaeota archaeon]
MASNPRTFSDVKGSGDRGPREFKTHIVKSEGAIMKVASSDVISTHQTNSIKNVAALIRENDVRRIPVIDAGTNRLEGIVAAIDILDFLGGGDKYNIIEKDYGGNFLAAINSPVKKIMRPATYLDVNASIDDAVGIMLDKRTSCIPIVDSGKSMKVVGLVSERDVLPEANDFGVKVKDVMQKNVITSSKGMAISDVSKVMVRSRLRRLPVVEDDKLLGVVTVLDVLGFLGMGSFKGVNAEENLDTKVEEIMESNVISVGSDDDLGVVCGMVRDTGYGGFPVAGDDNLYGIVTITDVLRWVYRSGRGVPEKMS